MKTLTVRVLNNLPGALVCCSSTNTQSIQATVRYKQRYKQQCDTSNDTSNSAIQATVRYKQRYKQRCDTSNSAIQATVYIVINGHRHSSIESCTATGRRRIHSQCIIIFNRTAHLFSFFVMVVSVAPMVLTMMTTAAFTIST